MPSRARPPRPAMYNTPQIRTGGFGALQVEAITNRPLSIARRHLAASQLRMRDIEPDELSSSEWVRFLVMEDRERDRWISEFTRRRRNSNESTSSADADNDTARSKAEEAREEAQREQEHGSTSSHRVQSLIPSSSSGPVGTTPAVSLWVRQFDEREAASGAVHHPRRPMHARRAVTDGILEAPPTYDSVVRARTPPPAYEPRSDDEGTSPRSPSYME